MDDDSMLMLAGKAPNGSSRELAKPMLDIQGGARALDGSGARLGNHKAYQHGIAATAGPAAAWLRS
jgi:hypothetical protein